MSTRKTRLQKIEDRLGSTDATSHLEEWQCVITLGGKNPGTHVVHRVTGEECRDSSFVREVEAYYEPRFKGKPFTLTWSAMDVEVELASTEAEGGSHGKP